MLSWMTAASIGMILVCYLPALPAAYLLPLAAVVLLPVALLGSPALRIVSIMLLAGIYASSHGHRLLAAQLPPELSGRDLQVEGRIVGLPEQHHSARGPRWRFMFEIEQAPWPGARGRLLLNWYGGPDLEPGQRWRLPVRPRRPRGFVNPGGFDYQAWLLRQGVVASGYVRDGPGRQLLPMPIYRGTDYWRYRLREQLTRIGAGHPRLGQLLALTLGDRSSVTTADWRLYAQTGTTHLMVISGLHVGLVAGIFHALMLIVLRLRPRLFLCWPDQKWAAVAGLLGAMLYAALAGFSLSTQRALIMVAVFALTIILERPLRPASGLTVALLLILIADPLAPTAGGFWLSFLAVAILLYGFCGRLSRPAGLRNLLAAQGFIFVGMVPGLAGLGLQLSLLAPLANLLAVPLLGLVLVPLALLGTFLLWLWPPLGESVLALTMFGLEQMHAGLAWLSEASSVAMLPLPGPSPWQFALLVPALMLMLGPWPGSWRLAGLLLGIAVVLLIRPPVAVLDMVVLDVGQGQAVMLRTRDHALVFDAGPAYGDSFDAGSGIIAPALRRFGVAAVDRLIVSHGDSDHAGGAPGLLSAMPVKQVLSSEPLPLVPGVEVQPCRAGQRWSWNQVEFEILNPPGAGSASANNRSCVMKVSVGSYRLLLTGDIEAAAERRLLRDAGDSLAAQVLLVPHHGSRSSSTMPFLAAVRPTTALVSAGWRNRFKHPHDDVSRRYRELGINMLQTGRDGALWLQLDSAEGTLRLRRWRELQARYWYDRPVPLLPEQQWITGPRDQ